MTFAGAKFLFQVFSILVSTAVTVILFLICYNFFLPTNNINELVVIGVVVVCAALGTGVGYLSYKFAKAWVTTLLGAWGGLVLFLLLGKVAGVKNGNITLVLALGGAFLGGYLGKQLNKVIRVFGTAFIGSFFVIRGLGTYLGGYPSETAVINQAKSGDLEYESHVYAYFGGFVVLFIVGALIQLRLFRDEDVDEDDMFENQDEARKCGCF